MTVDFVVIFLAALLAGAIASVSGFGIGSILTPLLALKLGTKLAVAIVSIPHLIGTALRFCLIKEHVDLRVLRTFGAASALGGLTGAVLHISLQSVILSYVLAALLLFAGILQLTGLASRMRFGRTSGWIAGILSGVFGGLVGNQGGIRSAALLGFDVDRNAFVATATAIGLIVDGFRMPVYAFTEWNQLSSSWRFAATAAAGVVVGTIAGKSVLGKIPERAFRSIVAVIILALGIWMFVHPE
jgi:uncharacterized protein